MLTKARLDQYIKDGQLVPIGTELETIELGKCKVDEIDNDHSTPIRCKNSKGDSRWYSKEFKSAIVNAYTSIIDPSKINSNPLTKDMLEVIIYDLDYNGNDELDSRRKSINSVLNHLLTAANDFPKKMFVWDDHEKDAFEDTVYGIFNNQYIIEADNNTYMTCKHARPIQQKPKELKDLKEGDKVWAINNCTMLNGNDKGKDALKFGKEYTILALISDEEIVIFDELGEDHYFDIKDLGVYFSLTPPTPAQIESARQSAIDEVNKRFDRMKGGKDE